MESDLQMALIGAGLGLVVLVVAYNKWQEHRHRRRAERAFGEEQRDVLLEPRVGEPRAERAEPRLGDEPAVEAAEGAVAPVTAGERPVREAPLKRRAPDVPAMLDARSDCIIRLEAIDPLEVQRLWAVQREQLDGMPVPVRWFGFDDGGNAWRALDAHSAGACHWFCAAMQLVNRNGPIGEHEFMRFSGGVQRVADALMALPAELPLRADALRNATELDRFCAEVDVQIGVNVVATGGRFDGTRIYDVARGQGLVLDGDGTFHARDGEGNTLFTVGNLEPGLFAADDLAAVHTGGLTLVIDVPRVADGVGAFDRMMQVAKRFADSLGGVVVDDNRTVFGAEQADMIRSQIAQFQQQMLSHDIPAGSPLAKRLFAA
jgi:hypothetical protein